MNGSKDIIKIMLIMSIIISHDLVAQSPSTFALPSNSKSNTKNKLLDACSKTYSGSPNQIEDCVTCAKSSADINSRRFINCMNSYETINERKNNQTGLDEILNNTPNCIKGVKSFGC